MLKSYLRERIRPPEELPKVATIQEFQGGERKVIIISTVISTSQDYLERVSPNAFILSSKMFNVSITRADSLLVVIGDPNSLQFSPDWMALIKYCLELGVYYGCQLPPILTASSILSMITDDDGKERVDAVDWDDDGAPRGACSVDEEPAGSNSSDDEADFDADEGYGERDYVSRFD